MIAFDPCRHIASRTVKRLNISAAYKLILTVILHHKNNSDSSSSISKLTRRWTFEILIKKNKYIYLYLY